MYFSDEIYLVKETRFKDELRQWHTKREEIPVWCDLGSVSSSEVTAAGQNGHAVTARATVHIEDYHNEKIVHFADESSPYMKAGYYDVYRTYINADTIELYLQESEGTSNGR